MGSQENINNNENQKEIFSSIIFIGHLKSDSEYICGSRDFRQQKQQPTTTKITNYLDARNMEWIVRNVMGKKYWNIILFDVERAEQSVCI